MDCQIPTIKNKTENPNVSINLLLQIYENREILIYLGSADYRIQMSTVFNFSKLMRMC